MSPSRGKSLGAPAVVIPEDRKYFVYSLDYDSILSFTLDNVKINVTGSWTKVSVNAGVTAIITKDGVVLRASRFATAEAALKMMDAEDPLAPGPKNPFDAYKDANGPGLMNIRGTERFYTAFERAMLAFALSTLETSKAETLKRKASFAEPKKFDPAELDRINSTTDDLIKVDQEISDYNLGHIAPWNFRFPPPEDERRRIEAQMAADRAALQDKRKQILLRYPMLARVNPKDFKKLSNDAKLAALGRDTDKILEDIETAKKDILDNPAKLWKVRGIVEATIAGLAITDPERRKWVQDKLQDIQEAEKSISMLKSVLTLGLGIGATIATGGVALVFAAGALGLSTYDALVATGEYLEKKAAAHTDVDPNKALIPADLDFAWVPLFLSWVAVVADATMIGVAIKEVKAGATLETAATKLAKGDEALKKRLLDAAGEFKAGTLVSEENRIALARRIGAPIEIVEGLGTEVRVYYKIDKETRLIKDINVRVGSNASAADVLLHASVVQSLERYSGVVGRLRNLYERFLKLIGKEPAAFPRGSRAFEAQLELEKLPDLIAIRQQRLASGSVTTAEAKAIEEDIRFLETEEAIHKQTVEQLALEQGESFIALRASKEAEALKTGYPKLPSEHYFYRTNPVPPPEFQIVRSVKAPGGTKPLRVEIGADGKPTGKFVEGGANLTREEAAEALNCILGSRAEEDLRGGRKAAAREVWRGTLQGCTCQGFGAGGEDDGRTDDGRRARKP